MEAEVVLAGPARYDGAAWRAESRGQETDDQTVATSRARYYT